MYKSTALKTFIFKTVVLEVRNRWKSVESKLELLHGGPKAAAIGYTSTLVGWKCSYRTKTLNTLQPRAREVSPDLRGDERTGLLGPEPVLKVFFLRW